MTDQKTKAIKEIVHKFVKDKLIDNWSGSEELPTDLSVKELREDFSPLIWDAALKEAEKNNCECLEDNLKFEDYDGNGVRTMKCVKCGKEHYDETTL